MKIIERFTLVIYSILMLLSSIILCTIVFGWLDIDVVINIVEYVIEGETTSKIVLGVSIVFILLSIRSIFFDASSSGKSNHMQQGVLLENESGKLMISKETIENLVNSVVENFESAKEVKTKVELDEQNNVKVYVKLSVTSDAIIKDLSSSLQVQIKEKIKKATDLEVQEVNITINEIAPKTEETEEK